MRREFCQACSFARYGVKGRVEHTCDGTNIPESPKHEYVPTREEIEKYLSKLKELMEPETKPEYPANRRARIDLIEPTEKAIYDVVGEIENLGADVRLTNAQVLLQQARDQLADYFDEKLGIKN